MAAISAVLVFCPSPFLFFVRLLGDLRFSCTDRERLAGRVCSLTSQKSLPVSSCVTLRDHLAALITLSGVD